MIGLIFPAIAIAAAVALGAGASFTIVAGLATIALVVAVNVYDRVR